MAWLLPKSYDSPMPVPARTRGRAVLSSRGTARPRRRVCEPSRRRAISARRSAKAVGSEPTAIQIVAALFRDEIFNASEGIKLCHSSHSPVRSLKL